MRETLRVYLGMLPIGELYQTADEGYQFCYDTSYLIEPTARQLSLALPLTPNPFSPSVSRAFFSNLLPEGQLRDHYAAKFRISAEDDFALLKAIGGDCAGAVSLYSSRMAPIAKDSAPRYRPLTRGEQEQLLDEAYVMDPSFLGKEEHTRLSLAGMQDKLPIAIINGELCLPLDGAPSSHILKPQNHRFPNLVENEAFCMALARATGLDVPATTILPVGDRAYIVERYDRVRDPQGQIIRLHQEDFCQASSVPPRQKYEINGGPGHAECFSLISRCKNPLADRIKLLKLIFFNLLIGNADAHAKNISLLYDSKSQHPSFAPAYDLVCTTVYDRVESEMAMKIGAAFHPRDIGRKDWQVLAKQIGSSEKIIVEPLKQMAETLPEIAAVQAKQMVDQYGQNDIYPSILEKITQRTSATLRCLTSS